MDNKIVLITGANRGIGKEIARQYAEKGHSVVLTGRDLKKAENAAEEIGDNCVAVALDVTDQSSVGAAVKKVEETYDCLDVLVNNAGIMGKSRAAEGDIESIQHVMDTNFYGAIRTTAAFLPLLKRSSDPRIINMSSGMGATTSLPNGGYAGYRLSKAALNAYTQMLAGELGDFMVAAMCPGWVRTDMGGGGAPRSVEKGADTAVWLGLEAEVPSGKFWRDREEINW